MEEESEGGVNSRPTVEMLPRFDDVPPGIRILVSGLTCEACNVI